MNYVRCEKKIEKHFVPHYKVHVFFFSNFLIYILMLRPSDLFIELMYFFTLYMHKTKKKIIAHKYAQLN